MPKTIDVCGNVVSLLVSNENCEVLSDTLLSKWILEDGILNNECTGFLISFESFCISCILKSTNRSKYVYSSLVYSESHIPPIQFTKCINGIPSLVDVICKIQSEHRSSGQYTIQFVTCSWKIVDRKKLMKTQRNKQHYETMQPSKKKMLLEKQQIRDTANKHDKQLKKVQKYKTMHSAKKNDPLNKKAQKYKRMDAAKKQDLLKNITYNSCIQWFKKKIKD